ncbi:MAG: VWA domain-containing protein [Planctomycetes bacterium]|nr:VWA domain-containing protein [Planctomycetota bacterium]
MLGCSFVNALFLFGLAAIAVPIIIHLLFKARRNQVEFSSIMFILASAVRKSSRFRLKELLLLLLRIAIFALITLAFARPFLKQEVAGAFGRGIASDVVIVLDDSFSMGYVELGASRFDRARQSALDALKQLGAESRAALVLATRPEPPVLTPDLSSVRGAVQATAVSQRRCNLLPVIDLATSALRRSGAQNRLALVISDFQLSALSRHDARPPDDIPIRAQSVGQSLAPNVAVLDAQLVEAAETDRRTLLVKIAGFSGAAVPNGHLSLFLDGKKTAEKSFQIKSGEIREIEIGEMDKTDAPVAGLVELSPTDGLRLDDRFHFVIQERPATKVLCVENTVTDIPYLQATHYLRTALSPAMRKGPSSPISGDLIAASDLLSADLATCDILVLADVAGLTEAQASRVESFVRSGGGLVLFLGPSVEVDIYNRWPVMPCRLTAIRNSASEGVDFWYMNEFAPRHLLFEPFQKPRSGDLRAPQFFHIFGCDVKDYKDTTVLASFDDGAPAILTRTSGQGKVMLFASTCDTAWTDLPKKMVYVPLMHQTVKFLVGVSQIQARVSSLVGESLTLRVAQGLGQPALLTDPGGKRHELRASEGKATFLQTDLSGIYRVTMPVEQAQGPQLLAVNVDTRESDLTSMNANDILRLTGVQPQAENPLRAVSEQPGDAEQRIWRWLLAVVLALMAAELVLANTTRL